MINKDKFTKTKVTHTFKPVVFIQTLVLCIYFFSFQATASNTSIYIEECKTRSKVTVNYLRCLDEKINLVQDIIERWNKDVTFKLEEASKESGSTSALNMFKQSQTDFGSYMESSCRWLYLRALPDTRSGAIAFKECAIYVLENQLSLLKRI
ncbi:lysozyme inhibitor LprI family protein [Algicola sagamiensis]|uniref:lysozyme inhibitor LprI family protein n=1 Tax=Algicola sagamiensis TaxID=163869 RepID=UPI0003816B61|nr:lysozyme inhibitor LprI family protein [Algicola sagamiensis]